MTPHTRNRYLCLVLAGIGTADPAIAEEPFTNEAVARGISYTIGMNAPQYGSGIAFVDLDQDGDADLVVTGALSGLVAVYENDGTGHFINRSADSGLASSTLISSVTPGDYDGDGDEDLHITLTEGQRDRLHRNDGNFQFTDVSAASGINFPGNGMGSTWGDFNGDGWLDLYVCTRTGQSNNFEENRLFRNNGDGTFTDVAAAVGAQRAGDPTLLATFFDYDSDGDADLYLGTDKGSSTSFTNHLLRNDNGLFTDVTVESGTEANVDCMGIAYGDIDHNGFADMFLTNIDLGHVMLMANGDGTFADESVNAGTQVFQIGWSCQFFDYNNDTFEDLFIAQMNATNVLFRNNNGTFPMEDMSTMMGLDESGTSFIAATADVDQDGDLDLAVATAFAPLRLYINHEGDNRDWVRLKINGTGPNTHAIGAQARITSQGVEQFREVRAGTNYKSDNERILQIGLGDSPPYLSRIEVRWPNSVARRILTGYQTNRTWTVWHPSRLGDPNADGTTDLIELQQAIDIMIARDGAHIEPGEEIYDMNGDCLINPRDILILGMRFTRSGGSSRASPSPVLP